MRASSISFASSVVYLGVSANCFISHLVRCSLVRLPADMWLGLPSRIRSALKAVRGRRVLASRPAETRERGRRLRPASERARSLSGGSPRSAGSRASLEARAVLLGDLSVEVGYRGAATRQSRRPPPPFSALFVPRQRDILKASPQVMRQGCHST